MNQCKLVIIFLVMMLGVRYINTSITIPKGSKLTGLTIKTKAGNYNPSNFDSLQKLLNSGTMASFKLSSNSYNLHNYVWTLRCDQDQSISIIMQSMHDNPTYTISYSFNNEPAQTITSSSGFSIVPPMITSSGNTIQMNSCSLESMQIGKVMVPSYGLYELQLLLQSSTMATLTASNVNNHPMLFVSAANLPYYFIVELSPSDIPTNSNPLQIVVNGKATSARLTAIGTGQTPYTPPSSGLFQFTINP